jgi:hypothetical protein
VRSRWVQVRRVQRVQRLCRRRLQVLHRLRGVLRVQLRLLYFVGRLPVHLLGASPPTDCVGPTQRVYRTSSDSFIVVVAVRMRTAGQRVMVV